MERVNFLLPLCLALVFLVLYSGANLSSLCEWVWELYWRLARWSHSCELVNVKGRTMFALTCVVFIQSMHDGFVALSMPCSLAQVQVDFFYPSGQNYMDGNTFMLTLLNPMPFPLLFHFMSV